MGKNRFLTRLTARALAVVVVAGGALLIGGVANAAPPAASSATSLADNGQQSTTTTLIVAPNSFPEGLPVALTAIVTPRGVAGTVQLKDGEVNVGGPVAVLSGGEITLGSGTNSVAAHSGVAFTLTSTLSVRTHSLTAVFIPSDPIFSGSTSPTVPLTVTPPIFTNSPLRIHSLLQSIFGELPDHPGGPVQLKLNLGPILGGRNGDPTTIDTAQIIRSVLGGLRFSSRPADPVVSGNDTSSRSRPAQPVAHRAHSVSRSDFPYQE